ncbi:class I SAM-dependent methyltransferase [Teichococcus aestuarii]|uniref:SAM-dependent methyltransferase n=1 Tax=Teichococcus aestuarii TaxID=568898 RepID=A0A2U1V5W2_9PROT|nr:methyltransferase domain-containing protein [Pseudoroseomonas aestuarii]PWC29300.1 SAM-dependent methyltransferase [Pseudoroseomonas aestuarii]
MATTLGTSREQAVDNALRDHPRAALDAHSVREAYRRWAGVYDAVFGGVSSYGRRRAVAAVNRLPGTRVLEVGVGTGLALPRYRAEKRVVGIDLSREMLLKAEERVRDERLAHVEGLLEMDAESMAFQDGAFDIAVAMFTASVVPDAKKLFAEMSRVVKPGGHLLFVNHFAAEGGPRWWVERTMAPLSRVLGWHPDFAFSDLFDREKVQVEALESCPPAGLFTLVHLRNAAPAMLAAPDRAVAA